jgi:hypothetical protein
MTLFNCDKIDVLERLQSLKSNERISDDFYTGINLTTSVDDANFELFGCWNGNGKEVLTDFHMNSIHQKNLIDLMKSYYATQPKSNNFRVTFGDNIYYDKGFKKLIKEDPRLNSLEFNSALPQDPKNDLKLAEDLIVNPVEEAKTIIETGFNALPIMPTFISLGNHDVQYKYILQYQIHKCMTQMTFPSKDTVSFGNWILPNAFYSVKFIIKNKAPVIFIFIDTNLFDKGEYSYISPSDKQKYLTIMLKWLTKTLEDNKDTVKIVIGHEPIFFYTHYKEPKKDGKQKEQANTSAKSSTDYIQLYRILKDNKVSSYMCADEHNFQWIYDRTNEINHLICGASPGGGGADVTNTFNDDELYFSTKSLPVPEIKDNFIKKMVLNAPSFMNMIVHKNLVQINIVSANNLMIHNKKFCEKKECAPTDLTKHEIYEIVTIPKYKDYISVYGCDGYLKSYVEPKCPTAK